MNESDSEWEDVTPISTSSSDSEWEDITPVISSLPQDVRGPSTSLTPKDISYILGKGSSGILGGIPETAAKNPFSGIPGAAGKVGVGISRFFNKSVPQVLEEPNMFFKPETKLGENIGLGADIVGSLVSPIGIGGLAAPIVGGIGKLFGKVGGRIANVFTDYTPEISKIENQIASLKTGSGKVSKEVSDLDNLISVMRGNLKDKTASIKKVLEDINSGQAEYLNQLSPKLREKTVQWFRDISSEYGPAINKAFSGKKVNISDVVEDMEQVASRRGLRVKPKLSEAETDFLSDIDSLKSLAEGKTIKSPILQSSGKPFEEFVEGASDIDLANLDQLLQRTMGKKVGKVFGESESILTDVRNVLSRRLKNVPEVKAVRSKYAPELQAKARATRTMKPFSAEGEANTDSIVSMLKRYVDGKTSPGENFMLKKMEERYPGLLDEARKLSGKKKSLKEFLGKQEQKYSGEEIVLKGKRDYAKEELLKQEERMKELASRVSELSKYGSRAKRGVELARDLGLVGTGAWGAKQIAGLFGKD